LVYTCSILFIDDVDMRYPKDIDNKTWDKMVEHTMGWLYMMGYLAVICVVLLIIKDVI
tara:strand:+ start:357 stop:530 length:174 start_codon:yes stop_codon:yes gene_type:complete